MDNTPYGSQQGNYQTGFPKPPQPPKPPGDGVAVASMVLGIISNSLLIVTCFWGFFLSLPCSIIGLILGIVSYHKRPSKSGMVGIVANIVAISVCVIVIILFLFLTVVDSGSGSSGWLLF